MSQGSARKLDGARAGTAVTRHCVSTAAASIAQLVEHALRKRMVVGAIPTGGLLKSSPSTQHYHGNATDAAHCLRVIDVRPGPCARPGLRMQICSESCFPVCAHGPQTLDRRSAPRICVVLMRKVHICIQYAQNAGFNGPDTVHIRSTYGPHTVHSTVHTTVHTMKQYRFFLKNRWESMGKE